MKEKDYRARAAHCHQMADSAPTEQLRADWTALADVWDHLASQKDAAKGRRMGQRNAAPPA